MSALPRLSPAADRLLHMLTNLSPHREVYLSPQTRKWHLTFGGGGNIPAAVVSELVELGQISPVYSDCPFEAYHVGRTLDCGASVEARKRGIKGSKTAGLIYKPEGWRPEGETPGGPFGGCPGALTVRGRLQSSGELSARNTIDITSRPGKPRLAP